MKNKRKAFFSDILYYCGVFAIALFISKMVLFNAVIPSGSMENTIMTGDRVFGNRLVYTFGEPKRGDIVIFKDPDNESRFLIKRLIGLPGDKIDIRDGKVYLNDATQPLDEPYLKETPIGNFGPYCVPENEFFMLGDNRNYSSDSRFWQHTYVKRDEIVAKAVFRYYPLDKMGTIK